MCNGSEFDCTKEDVSTSERADSRRTWPVGAAAIDAVAAAGTPGVMGVVGVGVEDAAGGGARRSASGARRSATRLSGDSQRSESSNRLSLSRSSFSWPLSTMKTAKCLQSSAGRLNLAPSLKRNKKMCEIMRVWDSVEQD